MRDTLPRAQESVPSRGPSKSAKWAKGVRPHLERGADRWTISLAKSGSGGAAAHPDEGVQEGSWKARKGVRLTG